MQHAAAVARLDGPALSCKLRLEGSEATVEVAVSTGGPWQPMGKFTLPLPGLDGTRMKGYEGHAVADAAAEGIVGRLVRVQLIKDKAKDKKGRAVYKIRIDNATPLILNGLALVGPKVDGDKVMLIDEGGGTATVTIADVLQSNGVIHVVDHVLLPKM